jgi:hypothetical protein
MQTKIKITEKNREKIAKILDSVQGSRVSVRKIYSQDIFNAAAAKE